MLEGADVEQRAGVEEDLVAVRVEERADDSALGDQIRRREHRPGGPAAVRGRVDDEHRGMGIRLREGRLRVARGQETFVRVGTVAVCFAAARSVGVVAQPARGVRGPFPRFAGGWPDFGVLPDDDGGPQVVDDERHLLGGMPPVHRADHGAEPRTRQEQFEHPVAGLPEPQHPRATGDTRGAQRSGEPGDASVQLGIGHAGVAAHRGGVAGTRPGMFGEKFRERRPGADRYRRHQASTPCRSGEPARALPLIVLFTALVSIPASDLL